MIKFYFLFIFLLLSTYHAFADPFDFSSIQKLDIIKKYPELLILLKKHMQYLERKNANIKAEVAGDINFSEYFDSNNVGKNLIEELKKIIVFYEAKCDFSNSQFTDESIVFFNDVNQQNTDQIKQIITRIRDKTSTYKDYFLAKEYLLSYYDVLTLKEAELRFTLGITQDKEIEAAKNKLGLDDIIKNIKVRKVGESFIFEYYPTGVVSSSSGGVNTGRDASSNTVYNRNFSTLHSAIVEFKDREIASFDCALWNTSAPLNLKDIAELFLAGINPSALAKILLNADGYLNFIASIFNDHDLWAHGTIMFSPLIPSQIFYPLQRFLALQGNLEKLRNIYLTDMDKAKKTKIFADFFNPILYFFSKGHERGSQFRTLLTQTDISRILEYLNDPNFYGGTEPWKTMNLEVEIPDTFSAKLMEGFSKFEREIHNVVNCSTGNCEHCMVK